MLLWNKCFAFQSDKFEDDNGHLDIKVLTYLWQSCFSHLIITYLGLDTFLGKAKFFCTKEMESWDTVKSWEIVKRQYISGGLLEIWEPVLEGRRGKS